MPREIDNNGWMQVRDNPIAKVGVFPYLGSEIKGAPDPDKVYRVYRSEQELSKQTAIDGFKLLPIIDDHQPIGPVYGMPAEQKGVQGMIGEQVYYSAPWVRGNIKFLGNSIMAKIDSGKIELSPGYDCDYEFTPGVFEGEAYDALQVNIRPNHLALVDEGRTGPDLAVQDKMPSALRVGDRITIDTAELLPMEFTPEQLAQLKAMIQEVVAQMMGAQTTGDEASEDKPTEDADMPVDPAGSADVVVTPEQEDAAQETVSAAADAESALQDAADALAEVTDAAEQVVATDSKDKVKLQAAKTKLAAAKVKAAQKRKIATDSMAALKSIQAKGSRDADRAELKQLREKVAKLEAAPPVTLDSGKFMAEIADRNQLADKVSQFVGTFDHSRMTLDAVAEYGVKKLGITAPKGSERIALDAWMHGRKPAHEQIITVDSAKVQSLDDAWAKQAEGK